METHYLLKSGMKTSLIQLALHLGADPALVAGKNCKSFTSLMFETRNPDQVKPKAMKAKKILWRLWERMQH